MGNLLVIRHFFLWISHFHVTGLSSPLSFSFIFSIWFNEASIFSFKAKLGVRNLIIHSKPHSCQQYDEKASVLINGDVTLSKNPLLNGSLYFILIFINLKKATTKSIVIEISRTVGLSTLSGDPTQDGHPVGMLELDLVGWDQQCGDRASLVPRCRLLPAWRRDLPEHCL